jgi:1,4-alpha-glucan branching enzyme
MQATLNRIEIQDFLQAYTAPTRYSARKMTKPVSFYCVTPDAGQVFLTGDFNDWDPSSHPMKRQTDGTWLLDVPLRHGHHHYQFLVDGKPTLDPRAYGTARNLFGEKVSLVAVS